ncbi:MAG: LysR family transcriptional regulator, partial [Pseudomonadota bacterium]|nr:LysR family transcriptional regulator [Pseudomonadota bacterium]MEC8483568.1 LysR family transcriptional regulator [Pseudomonadota bacterium]
MKCSTKPLPPLNSLKAFLVVMRQGSFRAAADVLLVSPQAVSQQIKLLEDILKITLFERRSRTIVPTKQADELYMFVNAGFEEISEGVRRVSNTDLRERISLNVSPYFASNYLINNLDKLRSVMPDADLRITSMIDLPDFATDNVDVSIQWGFGKWKGLDTSLLVRDPKVICCTPELAKRIQTPNDLKKVTLLYPLLAHSFWLDILNFLGIDVPNFQGDIEFQD